MRLINPEILEAALDQRAKALMSTHPIIHRVLMESQGAGAARLEQIVLRMAAARSGLLLIEEFEKSLHHSIQQGAWQLVFRMARELNVQVIATTHSRDAIESFGKAAGPEAQDGLLIRLTRRHSRTFVTTFTPDELKTAARHGIEVR